MLGWVPYPSAGVVRIRFKGSTDRIRVSGSGPPLGSADTVSGVGVECECLDRQLPTPPHHVPLSLRDHDRDPRRIHARLLVRGPTGERTARARTKRRRGLLGAHRGFRRRAGSRSALPASRVPRRSSRTGRATRVETPVDVGQKTYRARLSATQQGFCWPSTSITSSLITSIMPPLISTVLSVLCVRTRAPTGTGAGKRTLLKP